MVMTWGNPITSTEYLTIYQHLIDAMVIENEETNLGNSETTDKLNSLKSNCEIYFV